MGKASRRKREARTEPTIGLPHTPDVPFSLYEAARVSRFMTEDDLGRWQLRHFEITEEAYQAKLRSIYFTSDHPDEEMARAVPTGDYIVLRRRMIEQEVTEEFHEATGLRRDDISPEHFESLMPPESRWIPVMSDTPAEILEHGDALLNAHGRVLITGLGLGCLPHALLTKPEVTRIDIIDIDPEIIALTGKYLTDPRVHIWQGSAAEPQRIEGLRAEAWCWDYAWHDIWTHISARNLDTETAEHGISYTDLFELYEPYADQQSAWAIDLARMMRADHEARMTRELEFRRKVREAPLDEAVEIVYQRAIADKLRTGKNFAPFEDDEVPEQFINMIDPEGKLRAHIRKMLADPDFWEKFEAEAATHGPPPLGRPNAHLEANRGT